MKMSASTKLYLKQFVFIGVVWTISLVVYTLFAHNEFSILKIGFEALFVSVLASFSTVGIYLKEFKKKELEITDESLSVKPSEEIHSDISEEKLLKILQNDPFFGKMKMEKSADGLKLKTRFSWNSWGEKMRISISDSNKKIIIFSKPVFPFTVMDNRRNKYNVDRAAHLINTTA